MLLNWEVLKLSETGLGGILATHPLTAGPQRDETTVRATWMAEAALEHKPCFLDEGLTPTEEEHTCLCDIRHSLLKTF